MSRRAGPGNPRPATPPTQPVEGGEEPRDNSPEAVASQGWARVPPQHPSTRMTARSSKEDTEQQHERTEPKGHKTDRFVTKSQQPRDQGIRSQKEIEIDDLTFTLQTAATGTARIADEAPPKQTRNTWPPAQDITVSHCDCLTLVGPVQWSPQTEEQGRDRSTSSPRSGRKQRATHPRTRKESHWKPSMEYPKTPSRGRGQDEECIQKEKHVRRKSGGAPSSPNGQTPTWHQGEIHAKRKGWCQEQHPHRYTRNQRFDRTPVEERGRESEIPWTDTSIPYRAAWLPEELLASPPCEEDQRMETPRWKASQRGRRSRPIPRGGREATGPRPTPSLAKGPHRVHARSEDKRMWNPLRYRADRPTKGCHKDTPRTGRKNRSQEPNCSNSFIRDQIIRSRPDRGTPSWRNTDQLSKVDFVTIECEKNTHDPQGDPIAKQRRIDERKKPSFRSRA